MRYCTICQSEINSKDCSKQCSPRCKVLAGIQKLDNGCWIYKSKNYGAYGKIRWKMKNYLVHRVSYETFVGEIPKGKWICHKCDTPKCINPEHLFARTPQENRQDAMNKNRICKGEKNHLSRFTDIQIREIRLLRKEGFTYARLCNIFNASIPHIYKVIKNKVRK